MTRITVAAKNADRLRAAMKRRGVPLGMGPGEVEQWIEDNVSDLDSARAVLKRLALDVAGLKTLLHRDLERRD